ncbi:hypothetical protein D7Z54_20235 [Salibacterium salarium]|uniref:Uncharacterized protein n=1 Tax=Salibacterium salarium TaxID=284579 RepID=A0A428MZK1_9BACI|nr:hypothetical protein [Salibacterium salarium]RSL31568.1 hypothetical protein D7Z54_20235 [Salibacterium salarium]
MIQLFKRNPFRWKIIITVILLTLVLTAFTNFYSSDALDREQNIKELEDEFDISLETTEENIQTTGEVPTFNDEQVRHVLAYISEFIHEEEADYDVETFEPGEERDLYQLQLVSNYDKGRYPVLRHIVFNTVVNEAENTTSIENPNSFATGMTAGVSWIENSIQIESNPNKEDATFLVQGHWEGQFKYNNQFITFSEKDHWKTTFKD